MTTDELREAALRIARRRHPNQTASLDPHAFVEPRDVAQIRMSVGAVLITRDEAEKEVRRAQRIESAPLSAILDIATSHELDDEQKYENIAAICVREMERPAVVLVHEDIDLATGTSMVAYGPFSHVIEARGFADAEDRRNERASQVVRMQTIIVPKGGD